jgi:orotate phosphoribosyltransferase
VVVIEDTVTTGGSALKAIQAVEAEGGKVLAVLALVDREEGGREAIERAGYPVHTLVPRQRADGRRRVARGLRRVSPACIRPRNRVSLRGP